VIKFGYRRALHESSGKLQLPESSRLHEFASAQNKRRRLAQIANFFRNAASASTVVDATSVLELHRVGYVRARLFTLSCEGQPCRYSFALTKKGPLNFITPFAQVDAVFA